MRVFKSFQSHHMIVNFYKERRAKGEGRRTKGEEEPRAKQDDRIESPMSAEHIHFFLNLRTQIKLYHWQTRVYARHIATDQILEKLDKAIDSFVEIYLGKYGRNRLTGKNATFTVHNLTEAGAVKLIRSAVKYIQGALTKSLKENDTELANLRDEMVGELHQLLYLFSLH